MTVAVLVVVPALVWLCLTVALLRIRRRRILPAGALPTITVIGVAANAYPVAAVCGLDVPWWLLVPGLAVALVVGFGYMLTQMRRHRAVIDGPWPEHPSTLSRREERARIAAHYRAVVAAMDDNMTDSDRAGVDAPAHTETKEQR